MTNPPILLVGEAFGEAEAALGEAFVGPSGAELLRMLAAAGMIRHDSTDRRLLNSYYQTQDPHHIAKVWARHSDEVRRTNVFQQHPPGNDLKWFCGPKPDAITGYPKLGDNGYVRVEFEPELDRLCNEILELNPNIIICLGGTPLWALSGRPLISKWRGATLLSTHCVSGYKLLPTYHPAGVLYKYSLRPTVILDLAKATREAAFPEVRRPHRDIWIEPDLHDAERFIEEHITRCELLSVDIETTGSRITCIGFAPRPSLAIVIPFDDSRSADGSYWSTPADEAAIWRLVRRVLEDATIPKLFHNGLYDIAFLWRSMRIEVRGAIHDTMLLCHSLQPESLKGLGYCGSLWTDECAWKNLGAHHKTTIKKDD